MPQPFNSSSFFQDRFFTQPGLNYVNQVLVWGTAGNAATSKPLRAVYEEGPDPELDGVFQKRGGQWATIYILFSDYAKAFFQSATPQPQPHQEIIIGQGDSTPGITYRVEQWELHGDTYCIKALADQRKGMHH